MKQIVLILMAVALCGCASTTIKDPRIEGGVLSRVDKCEDLQFDVGVIVYGGKCPLIYTFVSQSDMPSVPLSSFEIKKPSSRSVAASGSSEFHYDQNDNDIVYVIDMSEQLIDSLKKSGLVLSADDPDYRIKATFERKFGKGMAGPVAWNVVMAVPSVFLPIPLLFPFDSSIEVILFDSEYTKIDSLTIGTTGKAACYSFWSLRALPPSIAEAEANATAKLILEMIQENERDATFGTGK